MKREAEEKNYKLQNKKDKWEDEKVNYEIFTRNAHKKIKKKNNIS